MNKQSHKTTHSNEHGSTSSYVVGFILSLIFTIIPYHLVVNKVISGDALLAAILGIGVVQMIIQLVFFLHLGRGPKPFYNVVFFFATAATIIVVIGASIFIMDNLYRTMSPQEIIQRISQGENIAQIGEEKTGACQIVKESHIVTIKDGIASPGLTEANLCDGITFVNEDDSDYEIAFGAHPDDISYGGLFEVVVRPGRSETVNLNQEGDFQFHSHQNPLLTGYFTVQP